MVTVLTKNKLPNLLEMTVRVSHHDNIYRFGEIASARPLLVVFFFSSLAHFILYISL